MNTKSRQKDLQDKNHIYAKPKNKPFQRIQVPKGVNK